MQQPYPVPSRVVSEREAAGILGVSLTHLRRLRRSGRAPAFVRLGLRRIGYRLRDLEARLESRLADPSSA